MLPDGCKEVTLASGFRAIELPSGEIVDTFSSFKPGEAVVTGHDGHQYIFKEVE